MSVSSGVGLFPVDVDNIVAVQAYHDMTRICVCFQVYDIKERGVINFLQFIAMLSVLMRATAKERLTLLFRAHLENPAPIVCLSPTEAAAADLANSVQLPIGDNERCSTGNLECEREGSRPSSSASGHVNAGKEDEYNALTQVGLGHSLPMSTIAKQVVDVYHKLPISTIP